MQKRRLFGGLVGWVGLAVLIVGVGLLAFSAWYVSKTAIKDSGYIRVEATVVEIAEVKVTDHRYGGYKIRYAEIAEYEVDGVTYRVQNNSASTAPKGVGSKITVAYNPDSPEDCFFPSSDYGASVVLFVLSAAFTVGGAVLIGYVVRERKMEILTAKLPNATFITSAAKKEQFITSDKPIIAVCGKSNVGKSSFINMLANQKKLAKVSKEPGRTRLINYFDFGKFILADLPGYGFARVSKDEKLKWARLLEDFFADKDKIAHVFALADIRHEPTEDDIQMINFLSYHIIPFTVIATKSDKLSRTQAEKGVKTIAAAYKCGKDDIISTSATKRQGLESVLKKIDKILEVNASSGQGADNE